MFYSEFLKNTIRWRVCGGMSSDMTALLKTINGAALTGNGNIALMVGANNLSEITSQATARGNLGLGTIATQAASAVSITGGSLAGLTGLGIRSSGSGAYDVNVVNTENLTAARALTLLLNDANRTLSLAGNLTTAGAFSTAGAYGLTLTATAATNVTLPTTGTLATLAGAESLSNKKLGSLLTNGLVTTSNGDGTLGVTAPASGILTFLATPSSANLLAALTTKTGTGVAVFGTAPTIAGGSITGLTSFGLRSSGTGAFDLTLANTENLTASRALTFTLNDAARSVIFSGNLTVAATASVAGTNTGDQTISITGDVTASGSSGALTAAVTKINGTSLAGLATGILKNTTTTGVPSIAVAGTDYLSPGTTFNLTVGYTVSSYNAEVQSAGTWTPDPANGLLQYVTNGGAFAIGAPAADCSISVLVINNATAGAITFSGFTVGANTGDALTATNASKFRIRIERINSVSSYFIQALQ